MLWLFGIGISMSWFFSLGILMSWLFVLWKNVLELRCCGLIVAVLHLCLLRYLPSTTLVNRADNCYTSLYFLFLLFFCLFNLEFQILLLSGPSCSFLLSIFSILLFSTLLSIACSVAHVALLHMCKWYLLIQSSINHIWYSRKINLHYREIIKLVMLSVVYVILCKVFSNIVPYFFVFCYFYCIFPTPLMKKLTDV